MASSSGTSNNNNAEAAVTSGGVVVGDNSSGSPRHSATATTSLATGSPYVQIAPIEVPKALQDGEKFIKWDEVSFLLLLETAGGERREGEGWRQGIIGVCNDVPNVVAGCREKLSALPHLTTNPFCYSWHRPSPLMSWSRVGSDAKHILGLVVVEKYYVISSAEQPLGR